MSKQLILTILSFHALALLLPASMYVLYRRPQYWHITLTAFLGFLVGFVDAQVDEVQFPVLLLLAFGFFIGFAKKEHAWLSAILLAIWVPLGSALRLWANPDTAKSAGEWAGSLLAFLPAFIGVYAGVLLHRRDADETAWNTSEPEV